MSLALALPSFQLTNSSPKRFILIIAQSHSLVHGWHRNVLPLRALIRTSFDLTTPCFAGIFPLLALHTGDGINTLCFSAETNSLIFPITNPPNPKPISLASEMFFSNIALMALTLIALAPSALAVPSVKISERVVGVHCGTTADATLSDCQQLVTPGTWDAAWAGSSNVCQ